MKKLYDLKAAEVSLVPRGANKKKFLVFKSDKGNCMPQPEQDIRKLIESVDPKTIAKVDEVLKSMTNKEEDGTEAPLSERAQAALKAVARILAPFKDEITDDHLDAVQDEVGIEPGEGEEPTSKDDEDGDGDEDVEMSMDKPEGVDDEHHKSAMDEAKKGYTAHLNKMGYEKYQSDQTLQKTRRGPEPEDDSDEDDDGDMDDVNKIQEESVGKEAVTKSAESLDLSAFPEKQRAQLEMIFKANQELVQKADALEKKNEALEKDLKIERDQRVLKEFQDKAKTFKHLGANTEELASVMKTLSETNKEAYDKIEGVLKAADAQIAQGADLYREIGTRGSSPVGDAEAQLNALVESVVKKSDGSKTKEQVYDEVCQTPEGKKLVSLSIIQSQKARG